MRILDIGCGKGNLIKRLLSEKGDYVGIDVHPWFNLKYPDGSLNYDFLLSDSQNLCFQEQSFDEVYCYDVLEHVADYEKVLIEICRVVKDKGLLFVSVPHPRSEKICKFLEPSYFSPNMHLRIFDLDVLQNQMNKRSLKVVEIKNDDFFSAVALTYRLLRKIPFENQSGYALKKDTILYFLQLLACLTDPPSWVQLGQEMQKRGLFKLYYPLLRLSNLFRAIEIYMSSIYPKTVFIRAVKIRETSNQ